MSTAKPIAPFDRDAETAVLRAFDRQTGQPVAAELLQTYADALAQYHLHPEDKFLGGDFMDAGRTERRHILAGGVRLIGKEANKWDEFAETGEAHDLLDYGMPQPQAGISGKRLEERALVPEDAVTNSHARTSSYIRRRQDQTKSIAYRRRLVSHDYQGGDEL